MKRFAAFPLPCPLNKLPRRKQRGIVEGNPLIISPQGAGNLPVEINEFTRKTILPPQALPDGRRIAKPVIMPDITGDDKNIWFIRLKRTLLHEWP
jgi:hypothetical protein